MNRKRKILTVVALAVFGAIIWFNYDEVTSLHASRRAAAKAGLNMQLLILAGSYAGLFFLFGGKDAEPVPRRPRNWRRIKIIGVVIAGLAVIAGLSVAIILGHEYDRQRERTRRANIEYEASKHRITSSEIDLIDLRLGRPQYGTYYSLTGRIRNRAAHNRTLNSITLIVTLREKEGSPDIVGQQTVQINVEVPPRQTRAINETIRFDNSPQLTQHGWDYFISEIRGSEGFTNPFDQFPDAPRSSLPDPPTPTPGEYDALFEAEPTP
jgi:hypothetical protein